jgi:hypothetical protein
MGKKPLSLLLFVGLLLVGGWFLYSKRARVARPTSPVATNWPASRPSSPVHSPRPAGTPPPPLPSAGESAGKREPPRAESGFVLRPGETLEYDANVTKLNSTVARLKITAVEKRAASGPGTWHLQALAHTENPYRMVFELDDQFDSYSDAGSLTSLQYEMHLNERGQKVDIVQHLLPSSEDPVPVGESGARVLPGTRDPLGMLEYLRGVDWSRTPEVRSPVYDGRKLYDVRAALVEKSAVVSVPAGSFNAMKIEIRVFESGTEMKDAHFLLYLANHSTRLPVLMEAVLPVATARVELTRAQ